jgi:nucleotide-binding universal stress UspA family protein
MEMDGIVVGVDGSVASVAALRWAITQAQVRQCPITAVEVRPAPHPMPGTSYAVQPYGRTPPVERTRTKLHDTVTTTVATIENAPEIVEMHLEGDPWVELPRVSASQGSTLVLGYTPHSRIIDFLFSQVTREFLRHSRCPVVVVPATGPVSAP